MYKPLYTRYCAFSKYSSEDKTLKYLTEYRLFRFFLFGVGGFFTWGSTGWLRCFDTFFGVILGLDFVSRANGVKFQFQTVIKEFLWVNGFHIDGWVFGFDRWLGLYWTGSVFIIPRCVHGVHIVHICVGTVAVAAAEVNSGLLLGSAAAHSPIR